MTDLGAKRFVLSRLQQERIDLGYLHPSEPGFADNSLARNLRVGAFEGAVDRAPRITFYAQPQSQVPNIDLPAMRAWLAAANAHRYPPFRNRDFVPASKRMLSDGVLAFNDHGEGYSRYLAFRTSGSVEYAPNCSWQWGEEKRDSYFVIQTKWLCGELEQFCHFLRALTSETGINGAWTILVNLKNARGAVLVGFGKGWEQHPRDRDLTTCLDDHLQLDFELAAGDQIAPLVRSFAERVEFAYGFDKPRVFNVWEPVGELEHDSAPSA